MAKLDSTKRKPKPGNPKWPRDEPKSLSTINGAGSAPQSALSSYWRLPVFDEQIVDCLDQQIVRRLAAVD